MTDCPYDDCRDHPRCQRLTGVDEKVGRGRFATSSLDDYQGVTDAVDGNVREEWWPGFSQELASRVSPESSEAAAGVPHGVFLGTQ